MSELNGIIRVVGEVRAAARITPHSPAQPRSAHQNRSYPEFDLTHGEHVGERGVRLCVGRSAIQSRGFCEYVYCDS